MTKLVLAHRSGGPRRVRASHRLSRIDHRRLSEVAAALAPNRWVVARPRLEDRHRPANRDIIGGPISRASELRDVSLAALRYSISLATAIRPKDGNTFLITQDYTGGDLERPFN
jgi:hypothetical protein